MTGFAVTSFPVKDAFQAIKSGTGPDAFVAELDPSLSGDASLVYSSYLGGNGGDDGYGIGVEGSGDAFVTGITGSSDFPTANAFQTTLKSSQSAFVTEIVPVATSAPTTTTLVSSANPSNLGQSVTFTATVAAAGAGMPGGAVTFFDGFTELAHATLDASGQATFTTAALTAGSHQIEAVYVESAAFGESYATAAQQVNQTQQASTTGLSVSAGSAYGQAVTLTATVMGPSGTPTGTITFMDGSTALGTATLNAGGVATFSTSALAVGGHSLTAVYGGDGAFAASASAASAHSVTQAASKAALQSSSASAALGQAVTFTVTLTAAAPGGGADGDGHLHGRQPRPGGCQRGQRPGHLHDSRAGQRQAQDHGRLRGRRGFHHQHLGGIHPDGRVSAQDHPARRCASVIGSVFCGNEPVRGGCGSGELRRWGAANTCRRWWWSREASLAQRFVLVLWRKTPPFYPGRTTRPSGQKRPGSRAARRR